MLNLYAHLNKFPGNIPRDLEAGFIYRVSLNHNSWPPLNQPSRARPMLMALPPFRQHKNAKST